MGIKFTTVTTIEIVAETAAEARDEWTRLAGTAPNVGAWPPSDDSAGDIDRTPNPMWKNTEASAPAAEQPAETVEEAPKRRGRKPKAQEEPAPPAAETEVPAQAISTDPENRVDPEADEEPDVENGEDAMNEAVNPFDDDEASGEDDLIGGYAVTGEGLQAAMQAHAAKFGLEETQKHWKALSGGFAKRGDVVAAGDGAVRVALTNLVRAIETGKAAG